MTFAFAGRAGYFQHAAPVGGKGGGGVWGGGETVYINHPRAETCYAGADPEK